MKSSTIRRSTLSRETMEVIENLAKEQDPNGLNEYVRPEDLEAPSAENSSILQEKAQEIDLLWQSFKNVQFNTKSPMVYISVGFLSGVIATLIVMGCLGVFVVKSSSSAQIDNKSIFTQIKTSLFTKKAPAPTLEEQADMAETTVDKRVSVPGEDDTVAPVAENSSNEVTETSTTSANVVSGKTKKYVVKDGDTVESIIKHYYGTYSTEKAELIMKANNMANLDRINIGQELIIPVEE